MKLIFKTSLLILALPVWAETIPLSNQPSLPSRVSVIEMKSKSADFQSIKFELNKLNMESHPVHGQFKVLSEADIAFSQTIGESQLPFKSLVVAGLPEEIQVTIDTQQAVEVPVLSAPAQPEDCRCETKNKKAWAPLKKNAREELYQVEYMGKFRGQDLSRVTVYAAKTNVENRSTVFYPSLEAQISSGQKLSTLSSEIQNSEYDLLIVTPANLLSGLVDFVEYKTRSGLKVKVVNLEEIGSDVAKITQYFKEEYTAAHYQYALIVGTDDIFPNHKVDTSGSASTPSDYPYFLMDANDMIPDVHYGRVVASTVAQVKRQTAKWIKYQDHQSEAGQFLKMIGIASNEGESPSDNQYVQEIEKDLNAGYGIKATHFYQDDYVSKPNFINDEFNKGTGYLVYLGHGSGSSWGSTGIEYKTTNVKQLQNADVLQPVIIDVACQNGKLKSGFFGETFMNATNSQGKAIGASMYYGGTVNISWHPPAIMAKGIVKQAIAQNLTKMGDALLAGQLYLMENFTDMEAVKDNFEWYHLFGDPSSPVHFN